MKKQSYVHIVEDNATNKIIMVKVTAYRDKASFKVLDNALVKFGHNKLCVHSFPIELNKRLTKPFMYLVGMKMPVAETMREALQIEITNHNL